MPKGIRKVCLHLTDSLHFRLKKTKYIAVSADVGNKFLTSVASILVRFRQEQGSEAAARQTREPNQNVSGVNSNLSLAANYKKGKITIGLEHKPETDY